MFRLTMSFAGRPVKKYTFDQDQITVGRDPACDVVIENIGASRRHATVARTPQGHVLQDLGSHNGTYVGGDRVERHILADNDEFLIGKYSFQFEAIAAVAAAATSAATNAAAPRRAHGGADGHAGVHGLANGLPRGQAIEQALDQALGMGNEKTAPISPAAPPPTAPPTAPLSPPVTEAIPLGLHAEIAAAAAPAGTPAHEHHAAAAPQDLTFRLDRKDIERIVGLAQRTSAPKLVQLHPTEHKRNVSLERPYYVLGADEAVDIRVAGFFAPPRAAVLLRTEHGWRALGFGKLKVNGRKAGDVGLNDGDLVEVSGSRFRFCHS